MGIPEKIPVSPTQGDPVKFREIAYRFVATARNEKTYSAFSCRFLWHRIDNRVH